MYTHPAFVRRGVGTLILQLSEDAARAEGFGELELYATLASLPLYRSVGFEPVELIEDATDVRARRFHVCECESRSYPNHSRDESAPPVNPTYSWIEASERP